MSADARAARLFTPASRLTPEELAERYWRVQARRHGVRLASYLLDGSPEVMEQAAARLWTLWNAAIRLRHHSKEERAHRDLLLPRHRLTDTSGRQSRVRRRVACLIDAPRPGPRAGLPEV